jgi:hypothetical protein
MKVVSALSTISLALCLLPTGTFAVWCCNQSEDKCIQSGDFNCPDGGWEPEEPGSSGTSSGKGGGASSGKGGGASSGKGGGGGGGGPGDSEEGPGHPAGGLKQVCDMLQHVVFPTSRDLRGSGFHCASATSCTF